MTAAAGAATLWLISPHERGKGSGRGALAAAAPEAVAALGAYTAADEVVLEAYVARAAVMAAGVGAAAAAPAAAPAEVLEGIDCGGAAADSCRRSGCSSFGRERAESFCDDPFCYDRRHRHRTARSTCRAWLNAACCSGFSCCRSDRRCGTSGPGGAPVWS
jgi:hypothetical protein